MKKYYDMRGRALQFSISALTTSAVLKVPILILQPSVFDFGLFLAMVGSCAYGVYKYQDNNKHRKAIDAIMSTDEYKEIFELYDEYVKDIAGFLGDLGFSPDLRASIAYKFGLQNGVFSKNSNYKYKVYKNDLDYFVDLYGSRISTGAGCCRHSASLLVDVINAMGGTATSISVLNCDRKNAEPHAVTGVLHDDKKIFVDTTVNTENLFRYGLLTIDEEKSNKKQDFIVTLDGQRHYSVTRNDCFSKRNSKSIEGFMEHSSDDIDPAELMSLWGETFYECCLRQEDFKTFAHDEKQKIKRLSYLNKCVCPHSSPQK